MLEIAGAILIVLGVIVGSAIALTLLWLVVAEWIYWRKALLKRKYDLLGGFTGETAVILAGDTE